MALPGLRGTEHVGFTVPDLDQADDFFVGVIGCERVYDLGPFIHDDDWMREQLNVDPRSVMRRLRFYRCGFGPNFEVFEWEAADGQRDQPRNSDVGGHHLAFYVDDLDAAVEYLRSRDIRVLGKPIASQNASTGQRWVYFLAPWGMQFELVSFPDGKEYEKNTPVLLWHPARPAD
jgi:catechol 2,3-dioxygenase-like lactoylglutathione lyase family enzyme